MTNATIVNGKMTMYKDPDDKRFYWANITADLNDMGTTASTVEEIVSGVNVLTATQIVIIGDQTWLKVKLGGLDTFGIVPNFCTLRTTCANGEQFDRTMWFVREDH